MNGYSEQMGGTIMNTTQTSGRTVSGIAGIVLLVLAGFADSSYSQTTLTSVGNGDWHASASWTGGPPNIPDATTAVEIYDLIDISDPSGGEALDVGVYAGGLDVYSSLTVPFIFSAAGPKVSLHDGSSLSCTDGSIFGLSCDGTSTVSVDGFFDASYLLAEAGPCQLNKDGPGSLNVGSAALPPGSVVQIDAGTVVPTLGGFYPLGAAEVRFNGGNLELATASGAPPNVTFSNNLTFIESGSCIALGDPGGAERNVILGGDFNLGSDPDTTATLGSTHNYTLSLGNPLAGAGNLSFDGGHLGILYAVDIDGDVVVVGPDTDLNCNAIPDDCDINCMDFQNGGATRLETDVNGVPDSFGIHCETFENPGLLDLHAAEVGDHVAVETAVRFDTTGTVTITGLGRSLIVTPSISGDGGGKIHIASGGLDCLALPGQSLYVEKLTFECDGVDGLCLSDEGIIADDLDVDCDAGAFECEAGGGGGVIWSNVDIEIINGGAARAFATDGPVDIDDCDGLLGEPGGGPPDECEFEAANDCDVGLGNFEAFGGLFSASGQNVIIRGSRPDSSLSAKEATIVTTTPAPAGEVSVIELEATFDASQWNVPQGSVLLGGAAEVTAQEGSSFDFAGLFTVSGILNIHNSTVTANGGARHTGGSTTTIGAGGTYDVTGDNLLQIVDPTGNVVVQPAGQLYSRGNASNQGNMDFDGGTGTFEQDLDNGEKGSIGVTNGGELDIFGLFQTSGDLNIHNSTVTASGGARHADGSSTTIGPGGTYDTRGNLLEVTGPTGEVTIQDGGALFADDAEVEGRLEVQQGASATFESELIVRPGGYAICDGQILGIATNEALFEFSTGQLTGLRFAQIDTATLQINLAGTGPGEFGRLIADEMDLDGTLRLVLVGYEPLVGDRFDLLDWISRGGMFDLVDLPPLSGGKTWNTSQLYTTGEVQIFPEPSTLVLLGVGVITLLGYAWRRRRN